MPRGSKAAFTAHQREFDGRFGGQTSRDYWIARITSRIQIDPDWKLSPLAQTELQDKTTSTEGTPGSEEDFGLGNSVFQAVLIRSLSDQAAFGFGARLVAPKQRATRPLKPMTRSASRRSRAPAFDAMAPPSNAATTQRPSKL